MLLEPQLKKPSVCVAATMRIVTIGNLKQEDISCKLLALQPSFLVSSLKAGEKLRLTR